MGHDHDALDLQVLTEMSKLGHQLSIEAPAVVVVVRRGEQEEPVLLRRHSLQLPLTPRRERLVRARRRCIGVAAALGVLLPAHPAVEAHGGKAVLEGMLVPRLDVVSEVLEVRSLSELLSFLVFISGGYVAVSRLS
jgi:hypothetical protein